ncbi:MULTISPECIES: hypothetical protein [Ralstonia]|mgnify:CR=1 FL=1|uniref:Lipoprotein n=2 Tax=Pseudomonadota TaxID=1224 RepID=A0AAW4QC39_RALPI|nr:MULTISPECIES: hypothetical protein [Ralstonia]MBX3757059.1 hypothetical protein [Ralstonia pickettii]MBX3785759.1 hypothetical protein [Ralstonia pickettii]MBX3791247.1 hypothetical protein [Ralstonia pickettii]MBX3795421.1 hypothetical protein [Ralstonia pickettii]MBX3878118.1 hypothetical protein [Ralstonia pickettii]
MIKFARSLALFACIYFGGVMGCSAEKIPPTQVAVLKVAPEKYADFVRDLDAALGVQGLRKFAAAPGLDDLLGRPVLYFEYKRDVSEKTGFLVATDIKGVSKIEFLVFENYFPDAEARKAALESVRGLIEKYGGTVVSGKF